MPAAIDVKPLCHTVLKKNNSVCVKILNPQQLTAPFRCDRVVIYQVLRAVRTISVLWRISLRGNNTQPVHISVRPIRFSNCALWVINEQRHVQSSWRNVLPSCFILNYPACLNHQSKCRVHGLIPFMAPLTINSSPLLSLPNKEKNKN